MLLLLLLLLLFVIVLFVLFVMLTTVCFYESMYIEILIPIIITMPIIIYSITITTKLTGWT